MSNTLEEANLENRRTNTMSRATDNEIEEAACNQLREWSRLPVPMELKTSLRIHIAHRSIRKISSKCMEPGPDQDRAVQKVPEKTSSSETGVMSLGA
jgi:hypothetical protein